MPQTAAHETSLFSCKLGLNSQKTEISSIWWKCWVFNNRILRKWVGNGFQEGFSRSRNSLRQSVAGYTLIGSLRGGFAQWNSAKTPLTRVTRENERHIRNQRPEISPKSSSLRTSSSLFSTPFWLHHCLLGSRQKGTKNTWRKCRPNELKIWLRGFLKVLSSLPASVSHQNHPITRQRYWNALMRPKFKVFDRNANFSRIETYQMSREWFPGGFSGSRNSLRWSVACYTLMGSLWGGFAPWKVPKTPLMDIARENEGHIRSQRPKISRKRLPATCKVTLTCTPPKTTQTNGPPYRTEWKWRVLVSC